MHIYDFDVPESVLGSLQKVVDTNYYIDRKILVETVLDSGVGYRFVPDSYRKVHDLIVDRFIAKLRKEGKLVAAGRGTWQKA